MKTSTQSYFLECRGVRIRYEYEASQLHAGLHATARGYCPTSPTGFYSCPPIEMNSEADARYLVAIMEDRAKQTDHHRMVSIRRARHTLLKRPHEAPWFEFVRLISVAKDTLQMGFFAKDADRVTLWQLAHRHYETALAEPASALQTCRNFKLRFPRCDIDKDIITPTRLYFETLRRFMRGDVPTPADFGDQVGPLGMTTYYELPPRLGGEPIIEIPADSSGFTIAADTVENRETCKIETVGANGDDSNYTQQMTAAVASTQLELF